MQCQRGKTSAISLGEVIAAARKSVHGYKTISQLFGVQCSTMRKIIHKWKTFKTTANLHEWMSQKMHPTVRVCTARHAQRNTKRSKSYISDPTGAAEHV